MGTLRDGPEQSAVVLSILKLGETLHLETVAEGIEDLSQLTELRALGAALGQGFYFAKPMPAEALAALLGAGDEPSFGRGAP